MLWWRRGWRGGGGGDSTSKGKQVRQREAVAEVKHWWSDGPFGSSCCGCLSLFCIWGGGLWWLSDSSWQALWTGSQEALCHPPSIQWVNITESAHASMQLCMLVSHLHTHKHIRAVSEEHTALKSYSHCFFFSFFIFFKHTLNTTASAITERRARWCRW